MTLRKVPARDLIVQVSDGLTVPTWLTIAGHNEIVVNPAENEEVTETTEYASAGDYEGMVMQRGASLQLNGFQVKDHLTDAQDPGQARCEQLANAKAYDSLGSVRFRHPAATQWKVWNTAFFSTGEQGGNNNAMTGWSCKITRSGASTTAAV